MNSVLGARFEFWEVGLDFGRWS